MPIWINCWSQGVIGANYFVFVNLYIGLYHRALCIFALIVREMIISDFDNCIREPAII